MNANDDSSFIKEDEELTQLSSSTVSFHEEEEEEILEEDEEYMEEIEEEEEEEEEEEYESTVNEEDENDENHIIQNETPFNSDSWQKPLISTLQENSTTLTSTTVNNFTNNNNNNNNNNTKIQKDHFSSLPPLPLQVNLNPTPNIPLKLKEEKEKGGEKIMKSNSHILDTSERIEANILQHSLRFLDFPAKSIFIREKRHYSLSLEKERELTRDVLTRFELSIPTTKFDEELKNILSNFE